MTTFINQALESLSQPQQPEDTRRKRIEETVAEVRQGAAKGTVAWIMALNRDFDRVWNNDRGLSPAEVVEGLGTDASDLFTLHAAAIAFLVEHAPASAALLKVPSAEYTIAHNEDGTVTLTLS